MKVTRGDSMNEQHQIVRASVWYVATLLICSSVADTTPRMRTCDEQIRLLLAADSEEAYEKAIQLGKAEEDTYPNVYEQVVRWEFVGLVDLEELPSETIEDGVEIKSHLFRSKDPYKLAHSKDALTVFRWERERRQRGQEVISEDASATHSER